MNEKMIKAMELLEKADCRCVREAMIETHIAMRIIDALTNSDEPLRVSELREKANTPYTIQRVTAILRMLCIVGEVQRIETEETEFVAFGDDGFGKMLPIVKYALA